MNDLVVIDDAYWGGKKNDGVRGRGATGNTSFVASISLTEEGHPVKMRLSKVIGLSKDDLKEWAKKHLSPNTLVVSDGLKFQRPLFLSTFIVSLADLSQQKVHALSLC